VLDGRLLDGQVGDWGAGGHSGDQVGRAEPVAPEANPLPAALDSDVLHSFDGHRLEGGLQIDDKRSFEAEAVAGGPHGAVVDELATIDDEHALAEALEVGDVVRSDQDGGAAPAI